MKNVFFSLLALCFVLAGPASAGDSERPFAGSETASGPDDGTPEDLEDYVVDQHEWNKFDENASAESGGWRLWKSGLLEQWGTRLSTSDGRQWFEFDRAFTHGCNITVGIAQGSSVLCENSRFRLDRLNEVNGRHNFGFRATGYIGYRGIGWNYETGQYE